MALCVAAGIEPLPGYRCGGDRVTQPININLEAREALEREYGLSAKQQDRLVSAGEAVSRVRDKHGVGLYSVKVDEAYLVERLLQEVDWLESRKIT